VSIAGLIIPRPAMFDCPANSTIYKFLGCSARMDVARKTNKRIKKVNDTFAEILVVLSILANIEEFNFLIFQNQ
jgi:hypothetical protein